MNIVIRYHENIAKRITAILLNKPFPDFKNIALSEVQLQEYEGNYKSKDGALRKVLYENNKLYTQRGNGRKIQIIPFSKDRFYYNGYLIELSFERNELGEIVGYSMIYDDGRIILTSK